MGIKMMVKPCRHCGDPFEGLTGTKYCGKQCQVHANITIEDSGCWRWNKFLDPDGYGRISIGKHQHMKAHRASFIAFVGDLNGLHVLHRCDNRACVNPDHLFLGTQADNNHDCQRKGRRSRGSSHPRAKLRESDIQSIRTDARPVMHIARQYGVGGTTIKAIKDGRTWSHVS